MGAARDGLELIRACRALVFVACLGCNQLNGEDRRAGFAFAGDQLEGSWNVNFRLDELQKQSRVVRTVNGTLVFAQIKPGGPSFPDIADPLDYGLYDIDFSSFGFDSRVAGAVPTAIARTFSVSPRESDSLLIVLNPERRGVIVLMRGQLRRERADGVWTAISSARSGIGESGSFVMTRARAAPK